MLKQLPSKTILILGASSTLSDMTVETPQIVAERIRRARACRRASRAYRGGVPDCGMKYLPRAVAFGKMKAMAEGAALVRRQLSGRTI